jgi:hypothetical protein
VKTFLQFHESLTTVAPWKWETSIGREQIAKFGIEGVDYNVVFFRNSEGVTSVEFSITRKNLNASLYGKTNTGNEYAVFGTVIAIIKDYVQRNSPNALYFTGRGQSRRRLYARFVELANRQFPGYHGQLGYHPDMHVNDGEYYIIKNGYNQFGTTSKAKA